MGLGFGRGVRRRWGQAHDCSTSLQKYLKSLGCPDTDKRSVPNRGLEHASQSRQLRNAGAGVWDTPYGKGGSEWDIARRKHKGKGKGKDAPISKGVAEWHGQGWQSRGQ